MRPPKRKRLARRRVEGTGSVNLEELAERVSYVGSPEHKDMPSLAGQARPRADASLCERRLTKDFGLVTEWLREAVRRGAVGGFWEGGFPRYAWYKEGDVVYEARLINQARGEYKGYPLNENEWPSGLGSIYE